MMERKKTFLQHFPKEEGEFVEKMMDLCQQVDEYYTYRLTPFLNPKQEEIGLSIARHFQLSIFSSRTIYETEFTRLLIAPSYYELVEDDFDIKVFELIYPRKYYELTHSQILGTLLHGIGMKREFIGDILVDEAHAFVFIDRKFAALAETDIQRIARVPVKWQERNLMDLPSYLPQNHDGVEKEFLLSSLRLDTLIATVFRLSRSVAVKMIESRQVKVDYVLLEDSSKEIALGQLISVRGYGRMRLKEIKGYSKQGKRKVEIEVIRK